MELAALRLRILAALRPAFGRGKTLTELGAIIQEANREEQSEALAYMVEKGEVRPPTGYGEIVIGSGIEPLESRYDLTAKGLDEHEKATANPKVKVEELLKEAHQLRSDYEVAFEAYRRKAVTDRAIGGIGVEVLYSGLGIPKGMSRAAVKALLKSWEHAPEYAALRSRFDSLHARTRALLLTVSEQTTTLRPPGNSARLLAKLQPVNQAVRLHTRVGRLVGALEGMCSKRLVFNESITTPPARPPATKTARAPRRGPSGKGSARSDALALMGIAVTVFIGVLVPGVLTVGALSGLLAALLSALVAFAVLVRTQKWWVPRLERMLAH